jgi:hypothetical protein
MENMFLKPVANSTETYSGLRPLYEVVVKLNFIYDYKKVSTLLKKVVNDFGFPKSKWAWNFDSDASKPNECCLIFRFIDERDALLFSLKYLQ